MNEITSRSLLNFVVEFSKPCNEDMQCDLEVSLPWDPFVKLREEVSKSRTCLMEQRKFEFEGSLEIQVPDTDLKKIEIREDYGQCFHLRSYCHAIIFGRGKLLTFSLIL